MEQGGGGWGGGVAGSNPDQSPHMVPITGVTAEPVNVGGNAQSNNNNVIMC